jgi:hypothetical protein
MVIGCINSLAMAFFIGEISQKSEMKNEKKRRFYRFSIARSEKK